MKKNLLIILSIFLSLSSTSIFSHVNPSSDSYMSEESIENLNADDFDFFCDDLIIATYLGLLSGVQHDFSNFEIKPMSHNFIIGFFLSVFDSMAIKFGIYSQRYIAYSLIGSSFLRSFRFTMTFNDLNPSLFSGWNIPVSSLLGPFSALLVSKNLIPIDNLTSPTTAALVSSSISPKVAPVGFIIVMLDEFLYHNNFTSALYLKDSLYTYCITNALTPYLNAVFPSGHHLNTGAVWVIPSALFGVLFSLKISMEGFSKSESWIPYQGIKENYRTFEEVLGEKTLSPIFEKNIIIILAQKLVQVEAINRFSVLKEKANVMAWSDLLKRSDQSKYLDYLAIIALSYSAGFLSNTFDDISKLLVQLNSIDLTYLSKKVQLGTYFQEGIVERVNKHEDSKIILEHLDESYEQVFRATFIALDETLTEISKLGDIWLLSKETPEIVFVDALLSSIFKKIAEIINEKHLTLSNKERSVATELDSLEVHIREANKSQPFKSHQGVELIEKYEIANTLKRQLITLDIGKKTVSFLQWSGKNFLIKAQVGRQIYHKGLSLPEGLALILKFDGLSKINSWFVQNVQTLSLGHRGQEDILKFQKYLSEAQEK